MGNSPSRNSDLKIPRSSSSNNTQQQQITTDDLNANEPNDPDDSSPPTITNKHTKNINIPTKQYGIETNNDINTPPTIRNKYKNTNLNTNGSGDFNLDIDVSLAKSFASSTTLTIYSDYCSSTSSNSSYGSNASDSNTLFTNNHGYSSYITANASKVGTQPIKAVNHLKQSAFAATPAPSPTQTPSQLSSYPFSSTSPSTPTPITLTKTSSSVTSNKHLSKHESLNASHTSSSFSSIPNRRSSSSKTVFLKRYPHDSSSNEGLNLDDAIEKLLKLGETRYYKSKDFSFHSWEIQLICYHAREIFLNQPSLLKLQAPIKVVGDVHGQFTDLLRILKLSGVPPDTNYLFLGDYVDRGKQSLETILLLLCYKIKYKENFFMLRGNHESANVTKMYGFYDECKRRKNSKVWKMFIDVFNSLPFAAIIQDKIFCVHGGISPELNSMSQIANIKRPTDIPDEGFLTDILWSDPNSQTQTWSLNDRGVSYTFGKRAVAEFCSRFKFDLIIRGHMVVEDGYEFFAKKKLVTIFSAPNYCGEFENWGAVMSVTTGMMCSFELLKPHSLRQKKSKK